jgi:hypothetical protein
MREHWVLSRKPRLSPRDKLASRWCTADGESLVWRDIPTFRDVDCAKPHAIEHATLLHRLCKCEGERTIALRDKRALRKHKKLPRARLAIDPRLKKIPKPPNAEHIGHKSKF